MTLEEVSSWKSFGGYQKVYKHDSSETGCSMVFSAYIPPNPNGNKKFPVLYYLSGLTCTEKNFIEKSGFQRYAAEHGIVVIGPDTSPRGCNIEGEEDSWDFGTGAGFYVDATEEKWRKNYRMYSYVTKELPALIGKTLPVDTTRQSIMGHSAGGHGAFISFLKNAGVYRSVSVFAAITNPSHPDCSWGVKALTGYLGTNQDSWKEYDATELISRYKGEKKMILMDQGSSDPEIDQLMPQHFLDAAKKAAYPVDYRLRDGYDHGYYNIATFIGEHISHHAKYLA